MPFVFYCSCRGNSSLRRLAMLTAFLLLGGTPGVSQVLQRQIGGVSIDAQGAIASLPATLRAQAVESLRKEMAAIPPSFQQEVPFRVISLAKLNTQLEEMAAQGTPPPPELRYLGGLLRVEYVMADPDRKDILIAGPAEPWTIHPSGDVVGRRTGHPVMQLDDLLIAFRSVENSRVEGITCSIDPTEEGRRNLQQFLRSVKRFQPQVVRGIEQALGSQMITLTGVPAESHFAATLVACDYQMKRYAMSLEPAPIAGMPGFLELIRARRSKPGNMMPRWWIACEHELLSKTEDGLIWRLPPPKVAVLTEEERISEEGKVAGTGRRDPLAQQWADTMTKKYDQLSQVDPMFAQLKNLVDLAVVATLIEKEGFRAKAACPLETLFNPNGAVQPERWVAPRMVASQGSFVQVGREFVITASGGVEINAWESAERQQVVPELADTRTRLLGPAESSPSWYWNAN